MQQLIFTLFAYLNNSVEQDLNYSIAKSFLEHIYQVGDYSLEETAMKFNVSCSSINRFCRKIGYKNFTQIKQIITYKYELTVPIKNYSEKDYTLALMENIKTVSEFSETIYENFLKEIIQAKRIVIFGFAKTQLLVSDFQKRLFDLGKICECNTNLYKQIDTLSTINKDDLLILISMNGLIFESPKTELHTILNDVKASKYLITCDIFQSDIDFDTVITCGKNIYGNVGEHAVLYFLELLIHRYEQMNV